MTPKEHARCLDEDCEFEAEGAPWEIIGDVRDHMQSEDDSHQVAIQKQDPESWGVSA